MNVRVLRQRVKRFIEFERLVFHRIDEAAVRTFSASIAYHAILALVSFASVSLFLIQVGIGDHALGEGSRNRLPADLRQAAQQQAQKIEDLSNTGVVLLTILGVGAGLYGLASGFAALFDALNRIHGTHRYASMMKRYARALIVALCFTASFTFAVVVIAASTAAGTDFFDDLGLHVVGVLASGIAVFLMAIIFVPVLFAVLLRYGSRARPPWAQCFAAGAVSGWGCLVFSLGFLAFLALAEPYRLYGAMGTALVILVFAYWACYLTLSSVIFAEEFASTGKVWLHQAHEAWRHRDRSLTWRQRWGKWRERRRMSRSPG